MKKTSIKKQTFNILIACSLITLILASVIFVYGMYTIRSNSLDISEDIGKSAAENSGEALKTQAKSMLLRSVNERSARIDMIFQHLGAEINMLAEEMTEITSHPERYLGKSVEEPKKENAGKLVTQLRYAPNVNADDPSLQKQIASAANIGGWLKKIYNENDMLVSTYVASASGFTITADKRSEMKFKEGANFPTRMDFRKRPWYKDTVKFNGLLFSDIYTDALTPNRAITCATPYYNAKGEIAGVVGAGMFLSHINTIVLSTKIGVSGYGFIIKKDGRVLFSPKAFGDLKVAASDEKSLFEAKDESLRMVAKHMVDGEVGVTEAVVDGSPCYIAYAPLRTMKASFGVVMEQAEITASAAANEEVIKESTSNFILSLNHSIYITFIAAIFVMIIIIIIVSLVSDYLANRLVHPMLVLNDGVKEIADGNLDKKLAVSSVEEIDLVAQSFNLMTDELKEQMENLKTATKEKERISTELSVATNIQESMLPNKFPAFPDIDEFDIYASMHAAKQVGGDFYDFYMVDSRHLMITIADVSGKGVPAALFMVVSKTVLQNYALAINGRISLPELISHVNDRLVTNNDAMMFVTAFVGLVDLDTGLFTYVNAGHNPPLIYRKKDDEYSYLKVKRNFVLAGMDELSFVGQEIKLDPGDKLYLYTDGVTEALSPTDELFGEERLIETLNREDVKKSSVKETQEKVKEALQAHVKTREQSDDITQLTLVYNGKGSDQMAMQEVKSLTVPAELDELTKVQDFVEEIIESLSASSAELMQTLLSVEEIFVNIASYAYQGEKGNATVKVKTLEPKGIEITFVDKGAYYDPLKRADPDVTAKAEDREIGGLGIFLVKKNMDELEYEYEDGENRFTMRKYFKKG
ncbi:MAG: SpoIIE family protein phosphatase [Selenomonadaceae bacterium]|nr:SpoIIE family protein phosphatase [Selenomonadaceae bacterium]